MTCKLLVLISGNGSNLQALIDACASGQLNADIVGVISNVPDAFGLERAKRVGIPTAVVDHKTYASRADFDAALLQRMQQFDADLVVLAGFMRILSAELVAAYAGRMLNIHPSLLPLYPGLHTHQRALDAGDAEHGCTIHFVTADLDGGPLIAQSRCPVLADDTAQTLASRVHPLEHALYQQVIAWYAAGRLRYANGQAVLDQHPLEQPVQL
ncbi:phosphoribosylglycinamide formyltransferase [Permianibacter sp. IMCC34836]|uniref:phosphoribosylglycinamide formyltransferase n=1 Tax=Permianibacter fluminis TaxID=2738515 RepID=UPI0015518831|nr:phosphoribosylglycinamide formyltransferase [Permianibacter fluminis]NQD37519.1 phosphoribosylglycinamide formyltransferase [Permianibacter fluminis]